MALLEVRGLVKKYGPRAVVNGVSFEVNAGEVVGLLGPNGAGKTTSFRMATGQIVPNDGVVRFNNAEVTHLPMYRRARLGMGYLSQEQSIFRKLTVEQNLIAILEALPRSRTLGRALTRSERWARTEEALGKFNLLHVRKNVAARCSGGEKRRLEIARCLVCEPLLILLDEPFAAVDPLTTEDIRLNIRDLARQGIGILVTDHNVREVLKITDRSYLIKDGKVVAHGTPDEIKADPVAIREYLGSTFADDPIALRNAADPPPQYRASPPTDSRVVPPAPAPELVPPNAVFNLYLPSNADLNLDGDDDEPPPGPKRRPNGDAEADAVAARPAGVRPAVEFCNPDPRRAAPPAADKYAAVRHARAGPVQRRGATTGRVRAPPPRRRSAEQPGRVVGRLARTRDPRPGIGPGAVGRARAPRDRSPPFGVPPAGADHRRGADVPGRRRRRGAVAAGGLRAIDAGAAQIGVTRIR